MSLQANQIYLYAAYDTDYANAVDLATTFSLPAGHVLGSFALAWTAVASGKVMVIAVGGPAHTALASNPCDFGALGTPNFTALDSPQDTIPAANHYMNAAGATTQDSYNLAYSYLYYALHGVSCTSCSSGGTPQSPGTSCVGRNPVTGNANKFGSICPTNSCTGSVNAGCYTRSESETRARNAGWDPAAIADGVLALMFDLGTKTNKMDHYMAIAAMEEQGCYNCPNACISDCSVPCTSNPPAGGEGFGVLQESWTSVSNSLIHASAAEGNLGQSKDLWFPQGLGPCQIEKDPGAAIAAFYWAQLNVSGNNCYKVATWIGGPQTNVCCAVHQYGTQTGSSCTSAATVYSCTS